MDPQERSYILLKTHLCLVLFSKMEEEIPIIEFTIFALQSVYECSQSRLREQFEPDSK